MEAEVVLARRVLPQPMPQMNVGGDCGPCVLGGLLGISVPEVYEQLQKGKVEPLSWSEMYSALWRAQSIGLLDRIVSRVPIWDRPDSVAIWGAPGWTQSLNWFWYVRMALDGGYYGVCAVAHDRDGPFGAVGYGDHWVLISGCRSVIVDRAVDNELLISNSSTTPPSVAEEWVEVHEFLKHWGGYNILLARPTDRPGELPGEAGESPPPPRAVSLSTESGGDPMT